MLSCEEHRFAPTRPSPSRSTQSCQQRPSRHSAPRTKPSSGFLLHISAQASRPRKQAPWQQRASRAHPATGLCKIFCRYLGTALEWKRVLPASVPRRGIFQTSSSLHQCLDPLRSESGLETPCPWKADQQTTHLPPRPLDSTLNPRPPSGAGFFHVSQHHLPEPPAWTRGQS